MSGRLPVANSSLTVLKMLGILVMLLDHYNVFVRDEYSLVLYEAGRLALPLFACVLGYNLARIDAAQMPKIMLRLLLFGTLATPLYNLLSGVLWHWWPLNVMFTLLLATAVVYLLALPASGWPALALQLAAVLLFVLAGSMVDYLWVGPALVVVIWRWCSDVSAAERVVLGFGVLLVLALLARLNQSLAGWLALPLIFLFTRLFRQVRLPRLKWFFYWFYPGHLLVLLVYRTLLQG